MIALLQRVSRAQVRIDDEAVGTIGPGLLVLLGVEVGDTESSASRLLERVLGYRVFNDAEGRMNLDLRGAGGALLLVPQFTLAADTARGRRPGFSTAAAPETARDLFAYVRDRAASELGQVQSGRFGADMQVELVNDGPVTFWLQVPPA